MYISRLGLYCSATHWQYRKKNHVFHCPGGIWALGLVTKAWAWFLSHKNYVKEQFPLTSNDLEQIDCLHEVQSDHIFLQLGSPGYGKYREWKTEEGVLRIDRSFQLFSKWFHWCAVPAECADRLNKSAWLLRALSVYLKCQGRETPCMETEIVMCCLQTCPHLGTAPVSECCYSTCQKSGTGPTIE